MYDYVNAEWSDIGVVASEEKMRPFHSSLIPRSLLSPVSRYRLSFFLSFFPHQFLHTSPYNPSVGPMATYDTLDSNSTPYGSGDPYYNSSTGYITPANPKKSASKWIRFGVPVVVVVIAGAVVAAVLATRHHGNGSGTSSKSDSGNPAAASSAISAKNAIGVYPTATDSEFMVPLYPSTVRFA